MVWYFIDVYIINRRLHGRLEMRNFASCVEKIFHSFAHSWEISYLRAAIYIASQKLKGRQNIFVNVRKSSEHREKIFRNRWDDFGHPTHLTGTYTE